MWYRIRFPEEETVESRLIPQFTNQETCSERLRDNPKCKHLSYLILNIFFPHHAAESGTLNIIWLVILKGMLLRVQKELN